MFESLKRRIARFLAASRLRLLRLWLRITGRAGRWVTGRTSTLAGVLFLVALAPPARDWKLWLPAGRWRRQRLPLVVMIHGCKQEPDGFAAGTRMNALADREGFCVLYPDQTRLANFERCWNWFDRSAATGRGEAAIVAAMVQEVIARFNIDRDRVYVAGMSSGAGLTAVVAACHGRLFAACAMHSGIMFGAADGPAAALRACHEGSRNDPLTLAGRAFAISGTGVPALVVHGTEDVRVCPRNAEQTWQQFAALNALALGHGVPVETREQVVPARDGARACRVVESLGGGTVLARRVMIEGLAHAWSGGDAGLPYNDPAGPDSTALIWDFFAARRREVATGERRAA